MSYTHAICAGAGGHSPRYSETDRHHTYPKFLCALLGVPIRTETVNLCAQCHDNVHHVLRHLINTGSSGGHRLSDGVHEQVRLAWMWWQVNSL